MTTTSKLVECRKINVVNSNDSLDSKDYFIPGDHDEVIRKLNNWATGRDCLVGSQCTSDNPENPTDGRTVVLGIEIGKVSIVTLF